MPACLTTFYPQIKEIRLDVDSRRLSSSETDLVVPVPAVTGDTDPRPSLTSRRLDQPSGRL